MANKSDFCKEDAEMFMDFLNHETFWLHAFKPTIAGVQQKGDLKSLFQSDRAELIAQIEGLNNKGIVCLALNERSIGKTKGDDIEKINSLVFDIDVRKSRKVGFVSTDEDHRHSMVVAEKLKDLLKVEGFVTGLVVDSGNGSQVYCKADLDNNPTTKEKLSVLEKLMAEKLNDEVVEVDCITKDINRRMKIPGTINIKDTEQVENRISKIVYSNDEGVVSQSKQNNAAFDKLDIPKTKILLDCSTGKLDSDGDDISRSAEEYRKVISLLRKGKTEEEVFKAMESYSKWTTAPPQYKELTFKKAKEFVRTTKKPEQEIEELELMDYRSLMDYEIKPVDWLIKDQIPSGEIGVLVGKRGEGKTWVALKQMLGVCSGKDVFADEVKDKKRVLFVDEESGAGVLAKRMQLLAEADGIKKDDLDLRSISFAGLKLDQADNPKTIKFCETVGEFAPDLIIVDCLQKICSFDIDKENALINDLFTNTIRPMMKGNNMSWMFIHHLRKSPTGNNKGSGDPLDEVRGGSELVNICRFVLSCSIPKNQKNEDGSMMLAVRVLKMSNSNMAEGKVVNFQPDSPDPDKSTRISMDYIGKAEDILNIKVRAANAIKEWLFDEGITNFRTKDAIAAKDKIGFEKTNLNSGLRELVDSRFLDKPKQGYYVIAGGKEIQQETLTKLKEGKNEKTRSNANTK